MASANQVAKTEAKKAIKEVAKEVINEAKNSARRNQGSGNRRNNNKKSRHMPKNKEKKTKQIVDKEVKQKLKKEGLEGPRSRFSVRVSATIGKIGPNTSQGPELQVATFLHPSLMKEPNDGTNFGPLQAAAAQWGLWRLASLTVRFTPLVGASAMTGSVYRISLNLTQSPSNASWGGLGARKHMDIPVGRQASWKLQRGDLSGPRATWWMTDTNEEGGQSCGPMIEIHGLGKSTSTYRDEDWKGDVFIVEVDGRWEFSNYSAKPALGTLDRKTEEFPSTASAKPGLEVGEDGVLTMTIPSNSQLARFMGETYEKNAPGDGSVGETIWQIVDEGAGIASSIAPTPFGWLIKGAWWFVKKIAGRGANSTERYQVFASLADAQNGKPVMAERMSAKTAATTLTVTQVNAPNVGPGIGQPSYHTSFTPFPILPVDAPPPPGSLVRFSCKASTLFKLAYSGAGSPIKVVLKKAADEYIFRVKAAGGSPWAYANGALGITNLVAHTVNADNQITGVYNPGYFNPTGARLYWRNTNDSPLGNVIAYAQENLGTSAAPFTLTAWLVLITKSTPAHDVTDMWPYAPAEYVAGGSSVTQPLKLTLTKASVTAVTKPDSTTHATVVNTFPTLSIGDYLLVYNIGKSAPGQNGFPQNQPLPDNVNDQNIRETADFTTGIWSMLTATVGPTTDYFAFQMRLPTSATDPAVDRILDLIQRKFKLAPIDESESDSEDEDSPSESDEEPCEEEPTPPQPTPRLKFAKEMMYEALRDSDWTHVDAEALLAAISSKN